MQKKNKDKRQEKEMINKTKEKRLERIKFCTAQTIGSVNYWTIETTKTDIKRKQKYYKVPKKKIKIKLKTTLY